MLKIELLKDCSGRRAWVPAADRVLHLVLVGLRVHAGAQLPPGNYARPSFAARSSCRQHAGPRVERCVVEGI